MHPLWSLEEGDDMEINATIHSYGYIVSHQSYQLDSSGSYDDSRVYAYKAKLISVPPTGMVDILALSVILGDQEYCEGNESNGDRLDILSSTTVTCRNVNAANISWVVYADLDQGIRISLRTNGYTTSFPGFLLKYTGAVTM